MQKIENKLNKDIGFEWWKHYIAAAFWSNVSTPINLSITLMTALTTTQTTTQNLMSRDANIAMSVCVLILTVLNTFFRPHHQMIENSKQMKVWTEFGDVFETIYFTENASEEDYTRRFNMYRELQSKINKYGQTMSIVNNNFLTDMIHICARKTLLNKKEKWVIDA